jgi:hypothetical protein
MGFTAERITVAATPTLLSSNATAGGLLVRNPSASGASIYIGGAAVTSAAGFEIAVGESLPVTTAPGELLYGVVASGTAVVHVLRGGV